IRLLAFMFVPLGFAPFDSGWLERARDLSASIAPSSQQRELTGKSVTPNVGGRERMGPSHGQMDPRGSTARRRKVEGECGTAPRRNEIGLRFGRERLADTEAVCRGTGRARRMGPWEICAHVACL